MCTDGFLYIQERYFGSSGFIGQTTTTAYMTWFFKIEHSNTGDVHYLVNAIQEGAEVFFYRELNAINRKFSSVYAYPIVPYVTGQSIWTLGRIADQTFHDHPYWYMELHKTTVQDFKIVRYNVDTATRLSGSSVAYMSTMEWRVNKQWKLAYETDINGIKIFGSKSTLLCLVRQGHRVRIGMGNVYEEASSLWIKNEELYGQTLDSMLSSDNIDFDSVPYRVVRMAATSGMVETYHIHLHGGQHILHERDVLHLRWFVDLENWKVANTNGINHHPFSDRSLRDGNWVRFLVETSGIEIVLHANSVETAGDPRVLVKSFKQFDVSPDNMTIPLSPPTWVFLYARSYGTIYRTRTAYDVYPSLLNTTTEIPGQMTLFAHY